MKSGDIRSYCTTGFAKVGATKRALPTADETDSVPPAKKRDSRKKEETKSKDQLKKPTSGSNSKQVLTTLDPVDEKKKERRRQPEASPEPLPELNSSKPSNGTEPTNDKPANQSQDLDSGDAKVKKSLLESKASPSSSKTKATVSGVVSSPSTSNKPTTATSNKPTATTSNTPTVATSNKPTAATSNTPTAGTSNTPTSTPIPSQSSCQLWVDKYRPTALKSIVGQTGDGSNAKKLLRWLQDWFKYHGSSNDKAKSTRPGLKDPDGRTFKVALLSGPPGIGKTTTAQLCCKELGYTFTEMNASDTRNKSCLQGLLGDALDNMTLNYSTNGISSNNVKRKHVIIMDEVDGMSGSQDRGGIAEVIMLLKTSRTPIICICNDRNSKKIRSLANYCFDLRFKHPTIEQLKGFVQQICFKEKLNIPKQMQQQLITSTDHDVRQILHQMQMFKDVETSDTGSYNPKKDLQFGPWDVARKVFSASEHVRMSIHDKALLFFHDYQFGPLFVQENYLKFTPKAAKGNRFKTMDLIRATAASLALGDQVENLIRRNNCWSLLPIQGMLQSVLPGEYMESDANPFVEFPAWFGKNSNQGKQSRILKQLHTHMHLNISGSVEALNMEYLPYLRRAIAKPLSNSDIDSAVGYMTNYSLLREDLDAMTEVALWPNMKDVLANLDTKTKTAFTRAVNKESFVPYSVVKSVSKRGKGGGGADDEELGLEGDEDREDIGEASDEEEEDEISRDAMIKVKKPRGKAAEKVAGSSKSKTSKSKASSSGSK